MSVRFAFWSHDIGGFEDTATPDIYKRWIAFGLLSSHSRLHGSSSYRVPWMFDEESVDVLRYFVNLGSLMSHIFGLACEARSTGIPVMRPMVMEFMDDPTCDYIDRRTCWETRCSSLLCFIRMVASPTTCRKAHGHTS